MDGDDYREGVGAAPTQRCDRLLLFFLAPRFIKEYRELIGGVGQIGFSLELDAM